MAFGLVVRAICSSEQDAIQVALGSFYPNLLFKSGISWPLEGMMVDFLCISSNIYEWLQIGLSLLLLS